MIKRLIALAVFSGISTIVNASGVDLKLEGEDAQKLFSNLPNELRRIGPGYAAKEAKDVTCSASANWGNSVFKCTVKFKSGTLNLTGSEAENLFSSLPHESERTGPGYIIKSVRKVSCSASPSMGNGTSARCHLSLSAKPK